MALVSAWVSELCFLLSSIPALDSGGGSMSNLLHPKNNAGIWALVSAIINGAANILDFVLCLVF